MNNASVRHKRINFFFLRNDYSESIADRALKFAHELDNCINSYNLEDQRSTVFSFPVVTFVLTLLDTKICEMRDCF